MAVAMLTLLATDGDTGASGRWLFDLLSWGAMVGVGLLAVFNTADAVSGERREGTLGLLFLTDLTAADVILGKLAAGGLVPMVCLLGMVPSLSIFVAFGGVSLAEFARTILALGAGVFYIMAATLLVSCFALRARTAAGVGMLSLGVSFAAIAASGTAWAPYLRWAPPVWGGPWAMWHGFGFASKPTHELSYWIAILGMLGVGCMALWAASRALSANWRTSFAPGVPAAQPSVEARAPLVGKEWPGSGVEAVAHLFYLRSGPIGWGASPGILFVVVLLALAAPRLVSSGAIWIFLVGVKVVVLQGLAGRGVQSLWQERRDGTLETLLATPMGPLEIVRGFSQGLRRIFAPALVLCGVLDGLAVALCLWSKDGEGLALVGLGAAIFSWAVWGLSWGSVWAGVNHERIFGGYIASLFCSVGVPVLVALWIGVGLFGGKGMGFWLVLFLASGLANRAWVSSVRRQAAKNGMAVMLRPWRETAPVIESEWSPINWREDSGERLASRPGS